jgi:hypothetical protein
MHVNSLSAIIACVVISPVEVAFGCVMRTAVVSEVYGDCDIISERGESVLKGLVDPMNAHGVSGGVVKVNAAETMSLRESDTAARSVFALAGVALENDTSLVPECCES